MGDEIAETLLLTSLEQFEALENPIRVRVLMEATEPVGVTELADRLGVPKTRLYYHVNLLAEHGLIEPVGERKSGARLEKLYRSAALNFRPDPTFFTRIDDPRRAADAATSVVIDPARAEVQAMLERRFAGGESEGGELGRLFVRLDADELEAFKQRFKALVAEFGDHPAAPARGLFAFTFALVPIEEPAAAL